MIFFIGPSISIYDGGDSVFQEMPAVRNNPEINGNDRSNDISKESYEFKKVHHSSLNDECNNNDDYNFYSVNDNNGDNEKTNLSIPPSRSHSLEQNIAIIRNCIDICINKYEKIIYSDHISEGNTATNDSKISDVRSSDHLDHHHGSFSSRTFLIDKSVSDKSVIGIHSGTLPIQIPVRYPHTPVPNLGSPKQINIIDSLSDTSLWGSFLTLPTWDSNVGCGHEVSNKNGFGGRPGAFLCVCVYVYIHVYICICVYSCIFIYINVHICIHL
jgi:hypothetical protein